ncbi:MAG: tetratricopeptide repeat protein [Candidatus Hodarchaeales archaeon]
MEKKEMDFEELKMQVKSRDSKSLDNIVSFGQRIILFNRERADYTEFDMFPEYLEMLEIGEQLLIKYTISGHIQQKEKLSVIMLTRAIIHLKQGNLELSFNLLKKTQEIIKDSKNNVIIADMYLLLGDVYGSLGEKSRSSDYYGMCLSLFKNSDEKNDYLSALNHIGVWLYFLGEIDQSIRYHQRALQFSKKQEQLPFIAAALHGLGLSYRSKGELDRAQDYLMKSWKIIEENRDTINFYVEMWVLQHLGTVHQMKDELDVAVKWYRKSLEISEGEKFSNFYATAWNFFHLITLFLEKNSDQKAKEYLIRFQKLNNEIGEIKTIKALYNLSEALILETSTIVENRLKARSLLEEVISEKQIQFQKIHVEAMIHLSNLLLSELKLSQNKTDLSKILQNKLQEISNNLEKITKDQTSYLLSAEHSFIQAKHAIVEKDLIKAQKLLKRAHRIADRKNLTQLAQRISSEFNYLLKKGETPFRILFALLIHQELSLRQLSEFLQITKVATSKHLKLLARMNIVEVSREQQVRSKQFKAKYYQLGPAGLTLFETLDINLLKSMEDAKDRLISVNELLGKYQMMLRLWRTSNNLILNYIMFLEEQVTLETQGLSVERTIDNEDLISLTNKISEEDTIKIVQYSLNDDQYRLYIELWEEFSKNVQKYVLDPESRRKEMLEKTKHVLTIITPLKTLIELERMKEKKSKSLMKSSKN